MGGPQSSEIFRKACVFYKLYTEACFVQWREVEQLVDWCVGIARLSLISHAGSLPRPAHPQAYPLSGKRRDFSHRVARWERGRQCCISVHDDLLLSKSTELVCYITLKVRVVTAGYNSGMRVRVDDPRRRIAQQTAEHSQCFYRTHM